MGKVAMVLRRIATRQFPHHAEVKVEPDRDYLDEAAQSKGRKQSIPARQCGARRLLESD